MVIDTNNINSSGGPNGARRSVTAAPASTAKTPTAPVETAIANKDNVVLSPEAQNLTRLQAKINTLPDVNLDRVAAIKQAIAEGRFEINPERIAENMLNQDELLN